MRVDGVHEVVGGDSMGVGVDVDGCERRAACLWKFERWLHQGSSSNNIVLFLFIFFLDAISYYCVKTFESQLLRSFYYKKYFWLADMIQMRVTCLFLLY